MDYNGTNTYGIYISKVAPAAAPANYFQDYGTNAGTDYSTGLTSSVRAYRLWGEGYSAALQGWTWGDYPRDAGVEGYILDGAAWGALAYQTSSAAYYGGYFTSTTAGTGKKMLSSEADVNIGIGAWGDLFGADIHGKVYGLYTEGNSYGLYAHGVSFKDNIDVHLQSQAAPNNDTMAVMYTSVSTDVTIQTAGTAKLVNGTCHVTFDATFSKVVSTAIPIIVTVTPAGNTNGVYVTGITSTGFTVHENNNGTSNADLSYIVIGRRLGYENPVLPKEVIAKDYNDKLSLGLHNDNDTHSDGKGLYYQNGMLNVGIHLSPQHSIDKTPYMQQTPSPIIGTKAN